MKYNDIKKAAIELCTTEEQEEWLKDYGIHCFLDGSRWRIENAWHDTREFPEKWKLCIVEVRDPDNQASTYYKLANRSEYEWVELTHYEHVERWAYVADLLPDRKEAEQ